jgi:UDP-N-acetylmuramoylalanine--D-glutamate ligase
VEYFDDSKGTNVGATVAALEGLGHERKLVLILGGDAKSQDFTPLIQPINRFARAVILLGRDADLIEKSLALVKIAFVRVHTMHEAVQKASLHAKSSDAVLLSPACSSLDMFKNYAHRGEVFIEAVQALSEMGALELVQAGTLTGVRT